MATKKALTPRIEEALRLGTLEAPQKAELDTLHAMVLEAKRSFFAAQQAQQAASDAESTARAELQRVEAIYSSVEDAFLRSR